CACSCPELPEQGGAGEARGPGDDRVGLDAEPLLEQRGVETAEVGGGPEVAVLVEPAGESRELADHRPAYGRAEQEAGAGGAVVGAARAVLLGAAPELGPDVHEHPVGQAARLEVALE